MHPSNNAFNFMAKGGLENISKTIIFLNEFKIDITFNVTNSLKLRRDSL